jgi:23S rRNA (adenine-N6)-dimethyltransferase
MRKLLDYEKGPVDSYLIMQIEAFRRFAGNPFAKESLVSILNKPYFSFEKFYEFVPSDFNPVPNAKVVMARIKKRKKTLINLSDKELFEDFVTFAFLNQKARITNSLEKVFSYKQFQLMSKMYGFDIHSSVSDLNIDHWLGLFESFQTKVPEVKHRMIKGFSNHSKKMK